MLRRHRLLLVVNFIHLLCVIFQVSFVVKAVSALTAAFRLVQLGSCGQSVEAACLRSVTPDLHNDILENLHKLSFTSMASGLSEVDGTRHHFTAGGRLVANKQIVYTIVEDKGLEPVSSIQCQKIDMMVGICNRLCRSRVC